MDGDLAEHGRPFSENYGYYRIFQGYQATRKEFHYIAGCRKWRGCWCFFYRDILKIYNISHKIYTRFYALCFVVAILFYGISLALLLFNSPCGVVLCIYSYSSWFMMTSSNGNIFCVTGPLCGEFTGDRWISPVTGEFPSQRSVTRSFDFFFDLRLNKRLSKHSWGWWFESPLCSLWCHCNVVSLVLRWPQCMRTNPEGNG